MKTQAEVVTQARTIEQIVQGQLTSDGAGVKLTRFFGHHLQQRLDPFLMLDAFGSDDPDDYIAGFPDHPHRGFETMTYMIKGRMLHRDSQGNEGLLETGGMQWMSAARGVVHSEIPQQKEGIMQGFQLWTNLAAANKMDAPWYKDFQAQDLPRFATANGGEVIVIAGQSHGVQGAVSRPTTEPLILDIHLKQGETFTQAIGSAFTIFAQVYEGEIDVQGQPLKAQQMGIFAPATQADGVVFTAKEDSRILLVAGKPLNEPIEQYGPFVMNNKEQIYQAVNDYRNGLFG